MAKLAIPDVREYWVKQGPGAHAFTSEQVNALIEADIARLAGIIEHANIKMAY